MLHLTQAQVRSIVGLTEEQFRSWRNAFPPLKRRVGQTPQFTAGEVMALLVIHGVVSDYGAKPSKISPVSERLFSLCTDIAELKKVGDILIISPPSVFIASRGEAFTSDALSIVVPLEAIRSRLQSAIALADRENGQLSFNDI